MVAQPVVLWSAGRVECIALHHWEADSYEIQIVDNGKLVERRWFDRSEDATVFAAEQGARFGAPDIGLVL
jgi:hypothetical protein